MPSGHRSFERTVRRRTTTATVTTALLALAALATAMAVGDHAVDPWTAGLAVAATTAVLAATRLARPTLGRELDEHDDPDTGVGNGRAALALLDREIARATGHGHVFSLALVELDHALYADTTRRRARRSRRRLYLTVAADLRLGDRVCRVPTARHDLMLLVLPETGPRGAGDVAARLEPLLREHLAEDHVAAEGRLRVRTLAHPTDRAAVEDLRSRLQVLEDADALVRDIAVQPVRMSRRPVDRRPIRLPEATTSATSPIS